MSFIRDKGAKPLGVWRTGTMHEAASKSFQRWRWLTALTAICLCGAATSDWQETSLSGGTALPALGVPVSDWFFSLKSSKGYCGLAVAASGELGISCSFKDPQHLSHFALLNASAAAAARGAPQQRPNAAATATASMHGVPGMGIDRDQDAPLQQEHPQALDSGHTAAAWPDAGQMRTLKEAEVVISGRPLQLLSRPAGLCGVPPLPPDPPSPPQPLPPSPSPPPKAVSAPAPTTAPAPELRRSAAHALCTARCLLARAWRCLRAHVAAALQPAGASSTRPTKPKGSSSGCARNCAALPAASPAFHGQQRQPAGVDGSAGSDGARLAADAPPRPVWCGPGPAAAQPRAGGAGLGGRAAVADPSPPLEYSFTLEKSDQKPDQPVDLSKDWLYLRQGDKYCTLVADLNGISYGISCHVDALGWLGVYKFMLQAASYPYGGLRSLATRGSCGIKQPTAPGAQDVVCGHTPAPPAGRSQQFTLTLQTPGAALVSGVVAAIVTYAAPGGSKPGQEGSGLVARPLQRCCPQVLFPHLLLCSPLPPPPGNNSIHEQADILYRASAQPRSSALGADPPAIPNECWLGLFPVPIRPVQMGQGTGSSGGGTGAAATAGAAGWRRMLQQQAEQAAGRALAAAAGLLRILARVREPGGQQQQPALPTASVRRQQRRQLQFLQGGARGAEGVVPEPALGAYAPVNDSSLIWLYAKAFGRYCSVSVDGTMLCVSAAASNASRNLFFIDLHPPAGRRLPAAGGP